jgi:hypothetical protein
MFRQGSWSRVISSRRAGRSHAAAANRAPPRPRPQSDTGLPRRSHWRVGSHRVASGGFPRGPRRHRGGG